MTVAKLPKIVTEASSYLVLPMPRQGMGTLRVDGHLLRVRRCPRCGLNTTIHECPLCATQTTTPSPETSALGSRPSHRAIPERTDTSTSSGDAVRLTASELDALLDVDAVEADEGQDDRADEDNAR